MNDGCSPALLELQQPLDPLTADVLCVIHGVVTRLEQPYFLAGATARDILLVNAFGLPAGRATEDIDFGVAVKSWADFHTLKSSLEQTGHFRCDPKMEQRLFYQGAIPVDIVPFGGICEDDGSIVWPPDQSMQMDVSGFAEALQFAVRISPRDGWIIPLVSIPGLATLKLIAWIDRHNVNSKDAVDLYRLFSSYNEAGNLDRLWEQEIELLESNRFDLRLAGAELLGRDVSRLCQPTTRQKLEKLLANERLLDQMESQIISSLGGHDDTSGKFKVLMDQFIKGFMA